MKKLIIIAVMIMTFILFPVQLDQPAPREMTPIERGFYLGRIMWDRQHSVKP